VNLYYNAENLWVRSILITFFKIENIIYTFKYVPVSKINLLTIELRPFQMLVKNVMPRNRIPCIDEVESENEDGWIENDKKAAGCTGSKKRSRFRYSPGRF